MDQDIAILYGVETKRLNEQVKRNIERFPEEFMFQLSKTEYKSLRSQFATSSWGGRRTPPYVFTEQGVIMLSAVLNSKNAIKVSVQVVKAFVEMRRFLSMNAQMLQRINDIELKQFKTDQKIERVLDILEHKSEIPDQRIFYNGQVFDAWKFTSDIIRSAKGSIILIDNYVDDVTLSIFEKLNNRVSVLILSKNITKQLKTDIKKLNAQNNSSIFAKEFSESHDRFLIIDKKHIYHIGASLKDLGKKWFAFSKINKDDVGLLDKLKKKKLI